MPSADDTPRCPVDHSSFKKQVSHWSRFAPSSGADASPHAQLSAERQVSSIPTLSDGNWIYPSEAQFFSAMARKNSNPEATDMKTIVPIHNAVNERAWGEVLKWEAGRGGEACGGVRLVTFKGKAGETSPKARWKMLLGCVIVPSYLLYSEREVIAIPPHLIATIGLWTAAGRVCAMLLIFIQVGIQTLVPLSTLMFVQRWIIGKL